MVLHSIELCMTLPSNTIEPQRMHGQIYFLFLKYLNILIDFHLPSISPCENVRVHNSLAPQCDEKKKLIM